MIAGTIILVVSVAARISANVDFNVVERFGTDVMLRCNFCHAHVKTIHPRLRIVKLTDSTALPISNGPPKG